MEGAQTISGEASLNYRITFRQSYQTPLETVHVIFGQILFRDLKQNLAFGRLPCIGKEAADLAVCIPFALVVSLRLDNPEIWGLNPSEVDALGTKIAKIRETGFQKALNIITNNPEHRIVSRLRARRLQGRLNRKPVNKPAAGYSRPETQAVSGF